MSVAADDPRVASLAGKIGDNMVGVDSPEKFRTGLAMAIVDFLDSGGASYVIPANAVVTSVIGTDIEVETNSDPIAVVGA
jgi:hypothetical protein